MQPAISHWLELVVGVAMQRATPFVLHQSPFDCLRHPTLQGADLILVEDLLIVVCQAVALL